MARTFFRAAFLCCVMLGIGAAPGCGQRPAAHMDDDDDGPRCRGRHCDPGGPPQQTDGGGDDAVSPPDGSTPDTPTRRPCNGHEDCLPFEAACGDDGYCFCPYKEDPLADQCTVDLCGEDGQCIDGAACWSTVWVCVGPTCGGARPPGEAGFRCDGLSDCPYGWICFHHFALCLTHDANEYPIGGTCNDPPCQNDSQCTQGRVCRNGWCRYPSEYPPWNECQTPKDCPPSCDCLDTKDGRRCIPWPDPPEGGKGDGGPGDQCDSSEDCDAGYWCREASTGKICVPTGDGGPPQGNDGGKGSPCMNDSDCTSPLGCREVGGVKQCVPVDDPGYPCDSDSDCCNGQVCNGGYCQDPMGSDGGPPQGNDGGGGSDGGSGGNDSGSGSDGGGGGPGSDGGGGGTDGGSSGSDSGSPSDSSSGNDGGSGGGQDGSSGSDSGSGGNDSGGTTDEGGGGPQDDGGSGGNDSGSGSDGGGGGPGSDGGGGGTDGGTPPTSCDDDRDCPLNQTCDEGVCVPAPFCNTVDYHGSLDGRCHGHYPAGGIRLPGLMTGHWNHCRCPRTSGIVVP